MVESSGNTNRRALRAYFCHACSKDFKDLVNLNDLTSVRCPSCNSDFCEDKTSYVGAQTDEDVRP